MTRIAYFDLANGISGDMALAALAHAGRSLGEPIGDTIADAVSSLDLNCVVTFVDEDRGGLACLRAEVKTDAVRHTPTGLREAIERAAVSDHARTNALRALGALVGAEAMVHGVDPDDVHFHELASADTAADLVGAAAGLDALGVREVAAAPVPVPSGWIDSEHGALPIPAPVTLELLSGARLRGVESRAELVTPSGAAILVGHRATFGPLPEIVLRSVGIGTGSRPAWDRPNISRVLIGEREASSAGRLETCVLLETNIDDQTPEGVGHAVESLIANGALDAWITPIVMKKSRPAFQLSVLTTIADESAVADALFRLTTTLGVRRRTMTRWTLDRDEIRVTVRGHDVRVKIGKLGDEVLNIAPEFADCVSASQATGLAPKDVYARAVTLAQDALDGA